MQFIKAHKITFYTFILTLVGLSILVITPPFQAPDEQTHLYRAYQISDGNLIAKHLSYGAGDVLPKSLSDSFQDYRYILFDENAKNNKGLQAASFNKPLNQNDEIETRFENTAPYPPLAYLPQILGVSIGKLFDASPVMLLYLARFFNLVFWLFIINWCMRRLPQASLAIFVFALVPIVAFQASSASADVATAAISLLFIVEIARTFTLKKISRSNIILLIILGSILALCKMPYVLITLLSLSIPGGLFKSKKHEALSKASITLVPFLLTLLWLAVAYASFVNLQAVANPQAQLSFILNNPIEFLQVLLRTYVGTPSDGLYVQMIGQLGWLDTKLPLWSIVFTFSAILVAALTTRISNKITVKSKVIVVTVLAITILSITGLLYLTWNSPGSPVVEGLQGRYYIPLFGLLLLSLAGSIKLAPSQLIRRDIIVYSLIGLSTAGMLITLVTRYYA